MRRDPRLRRGELDERRGEKMRDQPFARENLPLTAGRQLLAVSIYVAPVRQEMPQRLARTVGLFMQSGQIEVRVAQERILRQRIAISRNGLLFPLEILEQDGEVE